MPPNPDRWMGLDTRREYRCYCQRCDRVHGGPYTRGHDDPETARDVAHRSGWRFTALAVLCPECFRDEPLFDPMDLAKEGAACAGAA